MKSNLVKVLLLAAVLGLTACGRKGNSLRNKATQDRLGANLIDAAGVSSDQAIRQAEAEGITMDIVQIDGPHYCEQGQQCVVYGNLVVNEQSTETTTSHYISAMQADYQSYMYYGQMNITNASSGNVQIAGFDARVTAQCAGTACEQYYVLVELYKNGQPRYQLGLRYDFQSPSARAYVFRGASGWMTYSSFIQTMTSRY